MEQFAQHCGEVDILVNNAGTGAWKHMEETSPSEAAATMACPYQAAFNVTRLLLPFMVRRSGRHIVNMTSAAAYFGLRGAVGAWVRARGPQRAARC